MSKVDLIMHPVRIRVITTLAGRELTVAQIAAQLPDVAQATLYRHINALAEGGVLTVIAENPIRGTVEKVYALTDGDPGHLGPADMRGLSKDDHMRMFTVFIATLTAQFNAYLESREQVDVVADGLGYNTVPIYLTDADVLAMSEALNDVLLPYLQQGPGEGRQRRLFTTVIMPDA